MQIPLLPAGAIPYLSTKCSQIIPVLIPQHQAGGSYAVYMHPTSLRPQPTSLAVRSMTFESPGSANAKTSPAATASSNQTNQPSLHSKEPTSPSTLKRACGEKSLAGSPSKLQRIEPKVRLCEEYRAWWYIMFILSYIYIQGCKLVTFRRNRRFHLEIGHSCESCRSVKKGIWKKLEGGGGGCRRRICESFVSRHLQRFFPLLAMAGMDPHYSVSDWLTLGSKPAPVRAVSYFLYDCEKNYKYSCQFWSYR